MTDGAGASDASAAHAAVALAASAVAKAVAVLSAGDARTEALAELMPERRVLGIARAARMTPLGRVWRLGVLLLDADGGVYAIGRVVRAERPSRRSVTADAVAEQRSLRAAAIKGGFPEGETVNFAARAIDFGELARAGASGPLVLSDAYGGGGKVLVRWSPTQPDALIGFAAYLADRVDLLVHPPEGA
ncbi:hypothetical protein [Agromyces sp. Soil535]|uniref:hypothetical protein n=1 Tax=Agromyces sp. Soil535 TaxID=1736390 RepID=UPI0006F46A3D|nr:hypothetical protein [Agromyces sp. Soil535]KRE23119.1 hypothetical protein ASG80_09750 [Agromyces sp. Soil535]